MAEEKLLTAEELGRLSSAEIEKLMTEGFMDSMQQLGKDKIAYLPVPKEYLAAFKSAQEREAGLAKQQRESEVAAARENPFAPPRK